MNKLVLAAKQFWNYESGVTAIEYGLIAALIGVAIVGAVNSVGAELITLFGKVVTELK
jgi:pilus assembly protein Flp/PilA